MAYYCGECIVWRGSSDENRYGERWCSYSRRYERSDQNTYGCKGFLYAGRAVLTKVCEVLHLDEKPWFAAFDAAKEAFVVPGHMDMLVNYCGVGPTLAGKLDADDSREDVSRQVMDRFLEPARVMCDAGLYEKAVRVYAEMVKWMRGRYGV